ncbi:MAG TPA: hypothetical protein VMT52_01920, partial [Planctomycetota bacterium]|nr:hypothetical protein [Planctomycetota bacterium]
MEHAAQTAVLVVFWILLAPIALAIAAVMALPRILRSTPRCIGLVLEFVWLLLALLFHVVHSSLHALGMAQREHGYLFKAYARRVGRDVLFALRRAWRIAVAFNADVLRVLGAGGRLLRRKVSRRIRSSALPSEPCARLPGAVHDFEKRYRIVRRLPPGGSTAQLFVVRRLDGARETGGELVLKYFDLTL